VLPIRIVVSPIPCAKCREAKARGEQIAGEFPGQVSVKVISMDSAEAEEYGVVMPPTMIVGEVLLASGSAPRLDKLRALVRAELARY